MKCNCESSDKVIVTKDDGTKCKVKERCLEVVEKPFPKLMVSGHFVVWFTGEGIGLELANGSDTDGCDNGLITHCWDMGKYRDVTQEEIDKWLK